MFCEIDTLAPAMNLKVLQVSVRQKGSRQGDVQVFMAHVLSVFIKVKNACTNSHLHIIETFPLGYF